MRVDLRLPLMLMASLCLVACQRDEAASSTSDEQRTSEQTEVHEETTPRRRSVDQGTPTTVETTWAIENVISLADLAIAGPHDLPNMDVLSPQRFKAFLPPECPANTSPTYSDIGGVAYGCKLPNESRRGVALYFATQVGPDARSFRLATVKAHVEPGLTVNVQWDAETGRPRRYFRLDVDLNLLIRRYDEASGEYLGGCIFHEEEFISFADDEVDEAINAATCDEIRDELALAKKQGRGVETWYRPR